MDTNNIYLDKGKYGYGVFAKNDMKKGDMVEIGIMTVLNDVDKDIGNYNEHLFSWSDDRKKWAMGSGYLPFYNHSNEPNVKKIGDLVNNTLKVVALRNLSKDEELFNTYHSKKWRRCFNNFN